MAAPTKTLIEPEEPTELLPEATVTLPLSALAEPEERVA